MRLLLQEFNKELSFIKKVKPLKYSEINYKGSNTYAKLKNTSFLYSLDRNKSTNLSVFLFLDIVKIYEDVASNFEV